ncbi:hypothetical protein KY285_010592 [Solanum tuberosum]|nr:hypothetical protein KY289_011138 [Solanum tuberosum]KAH0734885.1 hypothetical protein KY285_010592 [Solanum tuberosum]
MNDKDEFNAAANIIVPIENPESSRSIADIRKDEKMAHMEQELEIFEGRIASSARLGYTVGYHFPYFQDAYLLRKS